MALKLHHGIGSNIQLMHMANGAHIICMQLLDAHGSFEGNRRWQCYFRKGSFICDKERFSSHIFECHRQHSWFPKSRGRSLSLRCAASDDGLTVNKTSTASSTNDVEEMRMKLNQSLQGEHDSDILVQSIHDAARVFELAIKENSPLSSIPWFSRAWLGVDKNAWIRTLSYQAAVHSLLQAACEIASRGDGRDRDINLLVQRSLLRQSAPLESIITNEFSGKERKANEWFWSQQAPVVVTSFVNFFEINPVCAAATTVSPRMESFSASGDVSLLILALSVMAAITKLGPAKISSSHFASLIPDVTGRLMEKLIEFISIQQAYDSMRKIGLCKEFLAHFGHRAARCWDKKGRGTEEISFWVGLVQKHLQRAIDRERIWSRLTTCESIEVLEKDLAIFGFFIALGRSTQSHLLTNGIDTKDDSLENLIRFLIGGSVLYYPQLSSISSYQLYVEVVCEELEWLQFYPKNEDVVNLNRENKEQHFQGNSKEQTVAVVIESCSSWIKSFIKYSTWLDNPSNIKAAKFLFKGHQKLNECRASLGVLKDKSVAVTCEDAGLAFENYSSVKPEEESFDLALQSVEEALKRLEELLQKLHVRSTNTGKEYLEAACSDLERIRKLKKEAEFLEASFRAKAASIHQDAVNASETTTAKECIVNRKDGEGDNMILGAERDKTKKRAFRDSRRLWSFLVPNSKKMETKISTINLKDNEQQKDGLSANADVEAEENEIHRFELLRNELIQLEKRVQRSTVEVQNEEDENYVTESSSDNCGAESVSVKPVQFQQKENIIGKSLKKIKETGTDVLQGTQLLAIDVGAAAMLLKRVFTGDEVSEKEKKALQRTVTDLASVIPIGILMLLPVTAVGHAAMLAAIQRYVPGLIPSAYGPERLDLLRKLEKMKELEDYELSDDPVANDSLETRSIPDD